MEKKSSFWFQDKEFIRVFNCEEGREKIESLIE